MATGRKRKGLTRAVLLLLCLAVVAGYGVMAFVRPLPDITPAVSFKPVSQTAKDVSPPWPAYSQGAIGAIGYGVTASTNSQTPLPMASIAKVMTALAVLRQRPIQAGQSGPTITITQADVDSYNKYLGLDGSVVAVRLGEQISEYQALQALLLPSANNMAETLSRWAFGSVDAYNTFANNYAQELGLRSVTITDPSGFLPTTVASAQDLTILGELALQNQVISEIVAQPSAAIPVAGTIYNYNAQLGQNNTIGIKTGNNDQDKGAFLFASTQEVDGNPITVIGTLMGGPNLGTVLHDSIGITQAALGHFTATTFVKAGQTVGTYKTYDGKTVAAVASKDLNLLHWDGVAFTAKAVLRPVNGSAPIGQQVGSVTVTSGTNHATTSVPVTLKQAISKPTWQWRLTHPF